MIDNNKIVIPEDLWGFEIGRLYYSSDVTRAFVGLDDKPHKDWYTVLVEPNIPYMLTKIDTSHAWVRLFLLYNNKPVGLHFRFTKGEMEKSRIGGLKYCIQRLEQ